MNGQLTQHARHFNEISAALRNLHASMQSLDNQIRHLAKTHSEHPPGNLPSNIEVNPKEQLKAITLSSGKEVETKDGKDPMTKSKKTIVHEIPITSENS